jgi:class 3 adenylate cyclase
MSRADCISNRNIKIITSYLLSTLGYFDPLFEGLAYPAERYKSPDDFFLNEDEWTTFDNFEKIFRRGKEISQEAYFYFNCGASTARLRSWGRLDYFTRIFLGPDDGFKRLPFFNKNFNDTKQIETVIPPYFDKSSGRTRTIMKVQYHDDIDPNKDYISDPYRRGLLSSIPEIWGLTRANIRQPLNPYDPVKILNEEPEFSVYGLDARMEGNTLTIKCPVNNKLTHIGRKVLMDPDLINGKKVFLGRYTEMPTGTGNRMGDRKEAVLITDTVKVDTRVILKSGELYNAPYFIMDISYEKLSLFHRFSQIFHDHNGREDSTRGLMETIDQLREINKSRRNAYDDLKKANIELLETKKRLEEYSINLENKVDERTRELKKTRDELREFNRNLKDTLDKKVEELKRYNELRRYLSPKLTEMILSSGGSLGAEPRRKMMTVMFTDIRNFSALTDSLEPEELIHLMDKYLSEMTRIIHRHDGTLNKMIGDGLLVFFGDPIPMKDHARRAILTALDMQKKVFELRDEWLRYGYELGIGIGINTGYMTVGNIGSDMHMDYTVIGNQVNVAARLESKAKSGQILVSQRTYRHVMDIVEEECMGEIEVKGIHNPVRTYNIKVV